MEQPHDVFLALPSAIQNCETESNYWIYNIIIERSAQNLNLLSTLNIENANFGDSMSWNRAILFDIDRNLTFRSAQTCRTSNRSTKILCIVQYIHRNLIKLLS